MPRPVPASGGKSSMRWPTRVKPSLRGTASLGWFSSSCTISTRSMPGRANAALVSAAADAVARPRRT